MPAVVLDLKFSVGGTILLREAIRCYECNSHNDSRCAMDIPPESLQKDCQEHTEGSKYTMCRKITQSIDFEVNGLQPDSRIIRSCGWEESNYKGRCYQRSGFGGRQEVCSCLTDLCNAATSHNIPVATVAVLTIIQFALTKLSF
ncbi:hypothetical protein RUM44_010291 [Polyplax serrata]|uniref:Protein sleepless n=1 Tax=Polyplax serrata TaxID=468196 RepID=A0ABR1AWW5_POLSC